MKPDKINYDRMMDKECIELCDTLNSLPGIRTFESCCGHLQDRYSVWFFCENINTISRLGRAVERNYSDGKWELLVDSTDTHPIGVFWLRTKMPFVSYEEMETSLRKLIDNLKMETSLRKLIDNLKEWFSARYDKHFQPSLPSDVDEAADIHEAYYDVGEEHGYLYCIRGDIKNAFIAGAEWQARQLLQGSPMPEDTVLFNKGVQEGRRLEREDMLKDAFVDNDVVHDGRIELEGDPLPSLDPILILPYPQFEPGDKVKVIVLKDNEDESK